MSSKQRYKAFFSSAALLVLLTVPTSLTLAASAAVSFTHKDWDLSCDNTLTCRAAGYAADNAERGATVLLTRRAGQAEPVINRVMLAETELHPVATSPELIIANRSLGPLSEAEDDAWKMNAEQFREFLSAMRKDHAISFREKGELYAFSSAGSSAVLLKMDDVQGRVNTPNAILRQGKSSEASVKEPIAMPIIKQLPVIDKALRDMTEQEAAAIRPLVLPVLEADKDHNCDDDRVADTWQIAKLNSTASVVSVPCWMAAYNYGDAFFLVDLKKQSAPTLITDSGNYYDGGEISLAMKGRGIGDCFSYQAWVWDGTTFAESARGDTGRCRLIRAGGAWDMPEYVSKVVKS